MQYSIGDYSSGDLALNKDKICIKDNWWFNLLLMKKLLYFLDAHVNSSPVYGPLRCMHYNVSPHFRKSRISHASRRGRKDAKSSIDDHA